MREICTYGSMRGRAYPTRGVPLYSTSIDIVIGFVITARHAEDEVFRELSMLPPD